MKILQLTLIGLIAVSWLALNAEAGLVQSLLDDTTRAPSTTSASTTFRTTVVTTPGFWTTMMTSTIATAQTTSTKQPTIQTESNGNLLRIICNRCSNVKVNA